VPDVSNAAATEGVERETRKRAVRLEVHDGAAKVALKRGDEERADDGGNRRRQQEQTKIAEHALRNVLRDILFDALCQKRPLKRIRGARHEGDDAEQRERYGDPARAHPCDPDRVREGRDHVNDKGQCANNQ
jgi:hypothetical protein